MPDLLDYAQIAPIEERIGRTKHKEQVPALDDQKGLYLHSVRLTSANSLQDNWNRVFRHDEDMATADVDSLRHVGTELEQFYVAVAASFHDYVEASRRTLLREMRDVSRHLSNVPTIDTPPVDPDRVVDFIESGGRRAVFQVLRELRKRGATAERALVEALADAMQTDSAALDHHTETFIDRARRLDEQGQADAALDLLYDSIDELLKTGKFNEVDEILSQMDVSEYSADILLGVLTATLPARDELKSRPQFFREVEQSLRRRGEYEDCLLVGLE